MRSAVLQFLLAGALVVAWIWMLGRPLLMMVARRSRRDSIDHFRYQQAALGRTVGIDPPDRLTTTLVRPYVEWRALPLEQRRLQVLLGGGLATFASALLAIALRGIYVRLFLVMTIGFTGHLLVGAWVGARELRMRDAQMRRWTIDAATRRSVGRSVSGGVVEPPDQHEDLSEIDDLLARGVLFDEGFFEPIHELDPQTGRRPAAEVDTEPERGVEEFDDLSAASEVDHSDAPFTSPVTPRPRPGRRPKGRPIYVAPEGDDGDETIRAVND